MEINRARGDREVQEGVFMVAEEAEHVPQVKQEDGRNLRERNLLLID